LQLVLFVIDPVDIVEKLMNVPDHEMNELYGNEVKLCAGSVLCMK
jgi:hypothetical protein